MHDLPFQGRLQQAHARPMSGEDLEAFGKRAAAHWFSGKGTLTSAVVETVKHAGLSPEQVYRVVEFANTIAYLDEFRKEGAPNRVIEFAGGPADPSDVLRDLNDGGGGTVFDSGLGDYNSPPAEKAASAKATGALFALFGPQDPPPDADPYREVFEMRDKLATMLDHTTAQVSGLEVMYDEQERLLYGQVKHAALEGTNLGEIVRAWGAITDDPNHIKTAFAAVTPQLLRDGVFQSFDGMGASLEKTGQAGLVNTQHPLVGEFADYVQTLDKLAELQLVRQDVETNLHVLDRFLKEAGLFGRAAKGVESFFARRGGQAASAAAHAAPQATTHVVPQVGQATRAMAAAGAADRAVANAAGHQGGQVAAQAAHAAPQAAEQSEGLIPGITSFFRSAAEPVRDIGHGAGGMLFGEGSRMAKATGDIAGGLVQYAPHIAGTAAAYRGYQHLQAAGQSPLGQKLKSFLPNSPENLMVQQELESRYNGGGLPYLPTGPFVSY